MAAGQTKNGIVGKLYNAAYKVGFSPWDSGPPQPELVELITGADALPPGRVLDLGGGAGSKSTFLAEHGWTVTCLDASTEALAQARKNAAERGVDIEFVHGDVTMLDQTGLTGPFDLLLDIGCCHGLGAEGKASYAKGLVPLAAPGATLFMFGFTKGPLSVKQAEIDQYFLPYWSLDSVTPGSMRRTPDAGPTWYRLSPRAN